MCAQGLQDANAKAVKTHEFRIGDHVIAPHWWIKEISLDRDTERDRDERRVKVGTVISEAAASGEFEYLYDMGDDWRHRLVIESDGGARDPPDDVGGPPGYTRLLAALANPDDEDHADMLSWAGGVFDPRGFDLNRVNREWRRPTDTPRSR